MKNHTIKEDLHFCEKCNSVHLGAYKECKCKQPRKREAPYELQVAFAFQEWVEMLGRCYDPSHPGYAEEGAKGIEVCTAWRHSFAQFFAFWMQQVGLRNNPK